MNLNESLKWRYAVKKYNDTKVSESDLLSILESINLAASSTGLQPYRVIVVENLELRQQLAEGGFNPQVSEASHLLVFAAIENLTESHIDDYLNRMAAIRDLPIEALSDFRKILVSNINSKSQEENFQWATKQAYIGLGFGLIAAAELQIDSTPMEGFNPDKFDEVLGLKELGLRSVVLLSLGYRDIEKDPFVHAAKVRLPLNEFIKFKN